MIVNVINYTILTTYDAPYNLTWLAGSTVAVFLDTTGYTFSVELDGTPITSGPFLFGMSGSVSPSPQPYYQWCDGTTLKKVSAYTSFPYATTLDYANSNQCIIDIVCDLLITGVSITKASSLISSDGSFTATTTSSNGVVRYGLKVGETVTFYNYTGIFTGLLTGEYILVTEDVALCRNEKTIFVDYERVYNDKYIGEYDDANGDLTKLVIQEVDYFGASSEVCFGANPIVLTYEESTKTTAFIASNLEVELLANNYGDFQDLFSQNDRQFKVFYYKNLGSGDELKWTGFVLSQFYSQQFVRGENNYVSITCSDQLGILKDDLFRDESGNKYSTNESQLFIIREILKKTGLELNIRIHDNVFDESMGTTITPLLQAFVDTRIFEELNNDEVLIQTIKVKPNLRLFQSLGYWWLVRSSDNVGSFDWIEYDFSLTEINTGTYNPVVNRVLNDGSNGISWINASQLLEINPMYGIVKLNHNLGFDDNFIDEGRFEQDDLEVDGTGTLMFKNWGVLIKQPGMTYGMQYIDNGDSKGAFFADLRNATGNRSDGDNVLNCIEIPCETALGGGISNKFKLSFQYSVYPVYSVPWIRISWMLRLVEDGTGDIFSIRQHSPDYFVWLEDEYKNDLYVSSFGGLQNFEILVPGTRNGTISVHLYFHNEYGREYSSTTDFKTYNPAGQEDQPGKRFIINDNDGLTSFYELAYSEEAESLPDIVRPNSYSAFDKLLWRLVSRVATGAYTTLVNKILFDNVVISYVPYDVYTSRNFTPPSSVIYESTLDKNIKQNYTDDFLLGDIPPLENSKNIYRGYLRLSNGDPTTYWYRDGIVESKKILNIHLDEIATQVNGIQRISSAIICRNIYYSFLDCVNYDTKRFLNAYYSLYDKRCEIDLKLLEVITGESGEPPVILGEFATAEFDNSLDNGE